jgi:hypothetical protein
MLPISIKKHIKQTQKTSPVIILINLYIKQFIMKKISLSLFITIMGITNMTAQIGVQTNNPQGAFHIDAAKDNPETGTPSAAQQANDIIVSSSGNMGIGTLTPTNKLEVDNGTAGTSGVKLTQLPSANVLATDATGNIISGNSESAGVAVTKQRLAVASPSNVLNSGSGNYSFRYSSTATGGSWQIRINSGATRQFNIWDTEYNGGNNTTGAAAGVWQLRTVKSIAPNAWTDLDDNFAGGANEYNVYHVYDLSTGYILRFTCTLSNISGIRQAMILEEF